MTTASLLPAAFVRVCAERLLLAVADGLYPARCQPCLNERLLDSVGATVAESEVVLGRTTLVAMAFHRELKVRVLAQELRIALNRGLLIRGDRVRVIVEVDVTYALCEQLFLGCRGGWRWRRWGCIHRYACRCLLCSSRALRHQVIGGRVGRRHLLRAIRLHGTDAINADVRGHRSLPGQRRGHTLINRIRVSRKGSGRCWWWRGWRGRRRCLLFSASTQHHDSAKDKYESNPLHLRA